MLEGVAASFSRAISDGFRSFGTQRLLANTDENDSLRVLAHVEQEVFLLWVAITSDRSQSQC